LILESFSHTDSHTKLFVLAIGISTVTITYNNVFYGLPRHFRTHYIKGKKEYTYIDSSNRRYSQSIRNILSQNLKLREIVILLRFDMDFEGNTTTPVILRIFENNGRFS